MPGASLLRLRQKPWQKLQNPKIRNGPESQIQNLSQWAAKIQNPKPKIQIASQWGLRIRSGFFLQTPDYYSMQKFGFGFWIRTRWILDSEGA